MKRACGFLLMGSMAGCLGGGAGSDFGGDGNNGDGDADMDGDADGDGDVRMYPAAPYWAPGEGAGGILGDMSFEGAGPGGATVSFEDYFQSWPETKAVVVIGLCRT
jgi:hypothetical protein